MSTVVCQGLQTCLDTPIGEARVVKLKVLSSRTNSPHSVELTTRILPSDSGDKRYCPDGDVGLQLGKNQSTHCQAGGWGSLRDLSENEKSKLDHCDNVPFISMSDESLNMCTEVLGNENGSAFTNSNTLFLSSSPLSRGLACESETEMATESSLWSYPASYECPKARRYRSITKSAARDFPPPLSSLSGSNCLRMLPRREEGRLVVEARQTPTTIEGFEIERGNGRVQLSMVRDFNLITTNCTDTTQEISDTVVEVNRGTSFHGDGETDSDIGDGRTYSNNWEDMAMGRKVVRFEATSERELEEYHRKPRRCKDGEIDKLLTWQRFSVAT